MAQISVFQYILLKIRKNTVIHVFKKSFAHEVHRGLVKEEYI